MLVTLYNTTAENVCAEQLFLRVAVCTGGRNVMFEASTVKPA